MLHRNAGWMPVRRSGPVFLIHALLSNGEVASRKVMECDGYMPEIPGQWKPQWTLALTSATPPIT